jgi:hypothetical protein
VRRRTPTLVAAAVLVLVACGLLVLDWEYLFTWALSGGSYPGPLYVIELPLTVGAITCAVVGKRLGEMRPRPTPARHHAHTPTRRSA